jgi:hypothetical protein
MVADIRAKISCSLGEVISGNWSDEAIAVGQGLIRCRGQLILRGIVVPTAGTIVKLAYVRDGQLAKVPRVLRVLSSFADPLRQTTTVQLGDKLVWLEQKKQAAQLDPPSFPPSPNPGDIFDNELPYPAPEFGTGLKLERHVFNGICWKKEIINVDDQFKFDFSKPGVSAAEQNPDRPADEELKAPVTISAYGIMAKCLAALEMTSTGIPLKSQYEEKEINLENGYVAAMEQLLSAESYTGYLDEQERLVIQSLELAATESGPLINDTDIIDIGPIGSGELPIDDPNVAYNELPPRQPAAEPDPVAPVANNFMGGSTYEGDTIAIPSSFFVGRTWFDPARAKLGGIRALYSVSAGTGGTVTQTAEGVIFEPEAGFNGTASFTYQCSDGYQLSNSASCYIRVSDSPPTSEQLERDASEKLPAVAPPTIGPQLGSGWSYSYEDGSLETTRIQYTKTDGTSATQEYTHTPFSSSRESYNAKGNVEYREERQGVGRAASLGNVVQRYLEQNAVPDVGGSVFITTVTSSTYRSTSTARTENSPRTAPDLANGICQINKACPADLAFPEDPAVGATHSYNDCVYRFNGTNWEYNPGAAGTPDTEQRGRLSTAEAYEKGYLSDAEEEKTTDVTTTYEPGEIAIGSINWPEGVLPPLTAPAYVGERTVVNYYRDRTRGITRTITTRFAAAYKTPEGQQRLAAQGPTYAEQGISPTWSVSAQQWIEDATTLTFAGMSTQTRYDVNYGLTPGTKGFNQEAATKLISDGSDASTESPLPEQGSTGNEPGAPDLSLPLTPAAPKTWDPDNGYEERWEEYQRHNARVLALRYARAQRAIAYGNRYGMSLQVVPWSVPRYPLEALYLDLAGVVGAYRTNGITVAFDSNGVVANVDALLVGGVGGTGTPYYPVPSTVTTLPLAPIATLNPGVVPWSSIPVPPDFDPTSPGTALDTIPSRDVVEYPETLAPDFIIPPVATTVTAVRGIKVGLRAKRFDYAVTPLEREVALGVAVGVAVPVVYEAGAFTVTGIDAALRRVLTIAAGVGAFNAAGQAASLQRSQGIMATSGAFSITGIDAVLRPSTVALTAIAGSFAAAGVSAGTKVTRQTSAGAGSITVAGNAANLVAPDGTGLFLFPLDLLYLFDPF